MSEINIKTGAASSYNKTCNTTQVCKAQLDLADKMCIMVGETRVKGNEDSATVEYESCRFSDACEAICKEGIRRVGGGLECISARAGTSSIELATKCTHDLGHRIQSHSMQIQNIQSIELGQVEHARTNDFAY